MLGFADARAPQSAPGCARWVEAPLDESVGHLVAHIRELRPDIVVTHDAYGGLTGHPDHVHTHRVTVLAVQAAGLDQLYPEAGSPWAPGALYLATHPHSAARALGARLVRAGRAMYSVPDEEISATVDVRPWLDQKLRAVMAHRSEAERGALPGRLALLPPATQKELMATEWYLRQAPRSPATPQTQLTV
jgi:N-acetyl-1-D-myo-inositol-2-amino-2-deoxy-alpha-D-glucopyranoside deacetylase